MEIKLKKYLRDFKGVRVVFRSTVKSQCGFGSAQTHSGLVSHSTINLSSSVNLTIQKNEHEKSLILMLD